MDSTPEATPETDAAPAGADVGPAAAAGEGTLTATVDNGNVTYVETYRDLDEPANSQEEIGAGTLNLTCP